MIPLLEIGEDKQTAEKIEAALLKTYASKSYILGKNLAVFENKFAKYIGVSGSVGVGNGTDAITLALMALGIGKGDKVLTVSFTSPFTAIGIVNCGATPIFCDVDEQTWTIDTKDAEKKIDNKTRAIVPVHIYGNPCDMKAVLKLAKKYRLKVAEDACQAHGAKISGKKIGSFGDTAAFSFYPTKNLGAIGDAGIVTTNNKALANKIRRLRNGGQSKRFWHEFAGVNSRMDELQAAVLLTKLKSLDSNNKIRSQIAKRYVRELSNLPISFQESLPGAFHAYHLFTIRTKKRDLLKKFLLKNRIFSDIYYPWPVHKQKAFRQFSKNALPKTEMLSSQILSLPMWPGLTEKDQSLVIAKIKAFWQ